MTAQIPTGWRPETYAVDESRKVVWKLGSFPADRHLWDKQFTLIPGYRIGLCDQEKLILIRNRIEAEEAKRAAEPFTKADEEIKYGPEAEGWARRSKPEEEKPSQAQEIDPLTAVREEIMLEVFKRGGELPATEKQESLARAFLDEWNSKKQGSRRATPSTHQGRKAKRGEEPLTPWEEERALHKLIVNAWFKRNKPAEEKQKASGSSSASKRSP